MGRYFLHLSEVDRKKAERINQELQKKLCQTFQTEAAIDLACDRVLREDFPLVTRSHREEILPPELEEIYGAVQAAGLARHRSQPREDINAGDTTMVWRHNKLTGRRGWTGPGVVVAVSLTRTSFWISMRGCLLKCSSEQVRKATDAEWLDAELSKTLATELLKSRQRSGRRGYVDVETEGQPTEETPADTRPDVSQILGAFVPAPSVLAPIPEEGDFMDTTMPEGAESGPETRPRQPESEPGSEPDRNVGPRLAPDQEVTRLDEVENSQSTTQTRGDVGQTPDGAHVDNTPDAASSTPSPYPLISVSNYLTVLPVETEFDSKAQAVVRESADAVTG